jgi:hypothetical protein
MEFSNEQLEQTQTEGHAVDSKKKKKVKKNRL